MTLRSLFAVLLSILPTALLQSAITPTVVIQPTPLAAGISTGVAVLLSGGNFTATGTMTLKEGTETLGTVSQIGGQVFGFTVEFPTAGTHVLVAYYSGDNNYAGAQSAPTTVQVIASSVTLSTTGPPGLVFGIQANVSGAGTCVGNVALTADGKAAGTMTLSGVPQSASFSTLDNPQIPAGPHAFSAAFVTSSSSCGPATSAVLSVYTGVPTSSTQIVSVQPNPSLFGQMPQVQVKVTAASGVASGTVACNLSDGTGLASGSLDPTGSAKMVLPSLPVGTWAVTASYGGSGSVLSSVSLPLNLVVQPALTFVSSASSQGTLAPESLASVYGMNLAAVTAQASGLPLPTSLGGVQISISTAAGPQNASLLFVSPGQVNFLVPSGATAGNLPVDLFNNGQLTSGLAAFASVSPAIFTADGSGAGAPIGILYTAHADGTQISQPVYACTASGCQASAIDVSVSTDTNVLVLYATGIRNAPLQSVAAQIGSVSAPVLFAGAQSQFPGLDQINIQLSSSLAGSGQTLLQVTASGQNANPVKLLFR